MYSFKGSDYSDINAEVQRRNLQEMDITSGSLDRVNRVMAAEGFALGSTKLIFVVGTNGKGSTCHVLANLLRVVGRSTFSFCSPEITDSADQYDIAGVQPSPARIACSARALLAVYPQEAFTSFELQVLCALKLVTEEKPDYFILEIGLGGVFDAANVALSRDLVILTSLGIDHQAVLGQTLEEIAHSEVAILRHGERCLAGPVPTSTENILVTQASKHSIHLWQHGAQWSYFETDGKLTVTLDGTSKSFALPKRRSTLASMTRSAAIALAALRLLEVAPPEDPIFADVLERFRLPGRSELIGTDRYGRPIYFDGGHNAESAQWLATAIKEHALNPVCIIAMLRTKDPATVIGILAPVCRQLLLIDMGDPDFFRPEELLAVAQQQRVTSARVVTGIEQIGDSEGPLLVTGSFHIRHIALDLQAR